MAKATRRIDSRGNNENYLGGTGREERRTRYSTREIYGARWCNPKDYIYSRLQRERDTCIEWCSVMALLNGKLLEGKLFQGRLFARLAAKVFYTVIASGKKLLSAVIR